MFQFITQFTVYTISIFKKYLNFILNDDSL